MTASFTKTGAFDPASGKHEHACDSCGLRVWTSRENVVCNCPGIKGLGDVVHSALSAIGIKAKGCGGCKRRRRLLNRLLPFKRNRPSHP